MSAELQLCSSGHTQNSIIEHKERNKLVLCPGKKTTILGAMALLLILLASESSLQKIMVVHKWASRHQLSGVWSGSSDALHCLPPEQLAGTWDSGNSSDLIIISRPTVHEAFRGKITFIVNQTNHLLQRSTSQRFGKGQYFRTLIKPNRNVNQYGLTVFRNVCTRPDGAIVTVSNSDEEILAQISKVPALSKEWVSTYNCSQALGCMGFESIDSHSIPANARWVPGTTTHIVPDKKNVFHNFADPLWPHVVGTVYPLNETTPNPINHFLVHHISTRLHQARQSMKDNTIMYQIRILGELAPEADFLAMDGLNDVEDLVCFEKFVLACRTWDRVSSILGYNVTKVALLRYRNAVLRYFGIPEPGVPLPPHRLRVAVYGRWDTERRRVVNAQEVVSHLRNHKNPPFVVTLIDELITSHLFNMSLPEVVSFASQTDVLITVHGANTWAALFMPKHAAVIEIDGPCGPSSWLGTIVNAVGLRHDRSNPWGRAVASPEAGNTTECIGPYRTPDMTIDLQKLEDAIFRLALPVFGPEDRITRHWLYNWLPHSPT